MLIWQRAHAHMPAATAQAHAWQLIPDKLHPPNLPSLMPQKGRQGQFKLMTFLMLHAEKPRSTRSMYAILASGHRHDNSTRWHHLRCSLAESQAWLDSN